MTARPIVPSILALGAFLWILVLIPGQIDRAPVFVVHGVCSADSAGASPAESLHSGGPAAVQTPAGGLSGRPEPGDCININTANPTELMELPGVGEVIAARIVDARNAGKRFHAPEDLRSVKGIGGKKLDKIRNLICF